MTFILLSVVPIMFLAILIGVSVNYGSSKNERK